MTVPTLRFRASLLGCLLLFFTWSIGEAAVPVTHVPQTSSTTIKDLDQWLGLKPDTRPPLKEEAFANQPLTRTDASAAFKRLLDDYVRTETPRLRAEWERQVIEIGKHSMKFEYRVCGKMPKDGWDLYLSFHGGGAAQSSVNDAQWKNQVQLYTPKQGIYVAPRAPTDTWNLWHQKHIDALLARLIEGAIIHMGVNPDRVYIMGYSAGGDGVYQLAPRLADRLAAASMMAGHPNETSPLGLRNIGFTIHVGEHDSGYNRNKVAAEWKKKLADLHAKDPKGYRHKVHIHQGMGHWMDHKDSIALEWMAKFTRNPFPERVVWKQDNVTHSQFYWLAVPKADRKARTEIIAERKEQNIILSHVSGLDKVTILLNDRMLDLDKPVTIRWKEKILFRGTAPRTLATLSRTFNRRKDPKSFFSAVVTVELDDHRQIAEQSSGDNSLKAAPQE